MGNVKVIETDERYKAANENWFIQMIKRVGKYRATYKNWLNVIIGVIMKRPEIKVKDKNGKLFTISWAGASLLTSGYKNAFFDNNENSFSFDFENRRIKFFGTNGNGALDWVFSKESYKELNVKDMITVDVGANIGDSSIYFALKEAKTVYAFEPFLNSFNLLRKNVNVNNLPDKIVPVNAGVGGKKTIVRIDSNKDGNAGSELKDIDAGDREIKIFDLQNILKEFNIVEAVLKVNCEGCEYGLFLDEQCDVIRKFKEIFIEYHYGKETLVSKLEQCNFQITVSRPIRLVEPNKHNEKENPTLYFGYIYAKRID